PRDVRLRMIAPWTARIVGRNGARVYRNLRGMDRLREEDFRAAFVSWITWRRRLAGDLPQPTVDPAWAHPRRDTGATRGVPSAAAVGARAVPAAPGHRWDCRRARLGDDDGSLRSDRGIRCHRGPLHSRARGHGRVDRLPV